MGAGIDFCGMIDRYLSLDGALGAELQQAMTPAEAVELLKDGVRRSTSGETSTRNRTALLSDAAGGQYPYAAVLSCIDSRAPVEQIFDAASGDLFVARVAGNVASPDLTASLEYATKYAGSKAILVLGHTRCGAVSLCLFRDLRKRLLVKLKICIFLFLIGIRVGDSNIIVIGISFG